MVGWWYGGGPPLGPLWHRISPLRERRRGGGNPRGGGGVEGSWGRIIWRQWARSNAAMLDACTLNHRLWPLLPQTSLQAWRSMTGSPQKSENATDWKIVFGVLSIPTKDNDLLWAPRFRIATLTCLLGTVLLVGTSEGGERIYLIRLTPISTVFWSFICIDEKSSFQHAFVIWKLMDMCISA